MKISAHWLNQYVQPGDLTPQEIEHLLTFAGLPIESIEPVEAAPGSSADSRLDVEVTSNRGDCLCHVGVARECAAAGKRAFIAPKFNGAAASARITGGAAPATPGHISQTVGLVSDDHTGCPLFTLRLVRGVTVGPSPAWLATALRAVGLRSINNVVDATNYVLFELGQPSHAFDLASLGKDASGKSTITVRSALAGERLTLLDGKSVELKPGELVVADSRGPLSLAGVMGGQTSGVTAATTDVLLEVATWDPVRVRTAARRLNIRTDSSHRYERVVVAETVEYAADRLAELVVSVAGGVIAPGVLSAGRTLEAARIVELRTTRVRALTGAPFTDAQIIEALKAQSINVDSTHAAQGTLLCTVPHHRPDVRAEIDLIEEVARTIGYDALPLHARLPVAVGGLQTSELAIRELGRVLTGSGFFETVTFSFTTKKLASPLLPKGATPAVTLAKVSEDRRGAENILRPSVLAGLLSCRRANQDAKVEAPGGVRLYEIASAYGDVVDALPPQTSEQRKLALLCDIPTSLPPGPAGPGSAGTAQQRRQAAVSLLRGCLDALAATLLGEGGSLAITPCDQPPSDAYEPGACGVIVLNTAAGSQAIGHLGLLSPAVQRTYELESPVAIAELELAGLIAAYPPRATVKALPTFPATQRDLSLIVGEGVRWSHIEHGLLGAINAGAMPELETHRFITTYRGAPLAAGSKSVTFRMTFRHATRTLTDDEVNAQVSQLTTRLSSETGAVVRTA